MDNLPKGVDLGTIIEAKKSMRGQIDIGLEMKEYALEILANNKNFAPNAAKVIRNMFNALREQEFNREECLDIIKATFPSILNGK